MMRKSNGGRSFIGFVVGLILIAVVAEPGSAQVKVLNNLVTQLLEVSQPPATPQASYTFTNPRDGWVFISSVAVTPGAGATLVGRLMIVRGPV